MRDPAFLFYPGDYLRDTQCLSEKSQVAYDRIMCEHMRNICISQQQLNFFTKRLTDDEKQEIISLLKPINGGFQIDWVAESIEKRRDYSESRRKNRTKIKETCDKDMKTYDEHMEIENEIVIEKENKKVKEHANESFILNEYCKNFFDPKYVTEKSIDMFDKLIRIDGYTPIQIQEAISNACNDLFWGKNFLSPLKLREKNKDKVYYIDVFLKLKQNGTNTADAKSAIKSGSKSFEWDGWKPGQ